MSQSLTEERGELPLLAQYYDNLKANYLPCDVQVNFAHAARQAYIALGFGLLSAAEQKVDATPMDSFDHAAVQEILGLREKSLRSVVIVPFEYHDEGGDWLLNFPKSHKSR